jgi:hypothetical protein
MRDVLDHALGDVCVELGFCSMPVEARDALADRKVLTATAFAEAVLLAEGFTPAYEKQWVKQIKARFVRRFGHDGLRAADYPGSDA